MNSCLRGGILHLALSSLLASTCFLHAQTPSSGIEKNIPAKGGELRLVVILSRHGVRPPTWTQERLDKYSALPWPKWDVPPGYLTPRGFDLLKRFGRFDRASYAQTGLFAATGCGDAAQTYVWADTDERTLESGRALSEGLFPDCPPAVHSLGAGTNDPLFHPAHRLRSIGVQTTKTTLDVEESEKPDQERNELMVEMQRVLNGCRPETSCTPAHAPEISLLGATHTAVNGNDDQPTSSRGSLGTAASFAEDFLLEFTEGMPENRVGWGNVSESQLRKFLELHSSNSDMTHRASSSARLEASNMLFHILRTLDQGVQQRPVEDAVGPANSKLVFLVGHDTNIAGVAALLGLHWTLDGRRDDTPPGTELAFELWQSDNGAYMVRLTVAMQTLDQMRRMQDLTRASPPAHQPLVLDGCDAKTQACQWEDFKRIVDASVDRNGVIQANTN